MACAPRNLSPVVGRRGGGQMGALVLGWRWDRTLEIPCTTDPMHAPSQPPAKRTRGALGGSTSTLGDPQDRASKLADPGQAGAAGSLPASLHASPCSAHGIPWPPTPPSRGVWGSVNPRSSSQPALMVAMATATPCWPGWQALAAGLQWHGRAAERHGAAGHPLQHPRCRQRQLPLQVRPDALRR